jgi:hypothetical protein
MWTQRLSANGYVAESITDSTKSVELVYQQIRVCSSATPGRHGGAAATPLIMKMGRYNHGLMRLVLVKEIHD